MAGFKYPAKHIRGLAYFVANKKEISKSEYSGGQETETFLKKLGFTVQYKKDTLKPIEKSKTTAKPTEQTEPRKTISKKFNFGSKRAQNIERASISALTLLFKLLKEEQA